VKEQKFIKQRGKEKKSPNVGGPCMNSLLKKEILVPGKHKVPSSNPSTIKK
jgi:hypothetical protein